MLRLQAGDIIAKNYRLESHIDTGGFADVWKATFLNAGNTVALKIYPKLDAEGAKTIELEYSNQAELSHSNLVIARYFGFHDGYPFLEMRYCSGGNAASKIGEMGEKELIRCMHDISQALEYLHSEDIVHQDIKPNNFLIDSKGKYHLADLGLSLKLRATIQRFTTTTSGNNNLVAGTTPPCYRAPEICDRAGMAARPIKATDIWAFGASLFELATGQLPFGEFGGFTQIGSPQVPDLPGKFSAELNAMIKKCLAVNPWERPKASELAAWSRGDVAPERKTIYVPRADSPVSPPVNTGPAFDAGVAATGREPKSSQGLKILIVLLIALVATGGGMWHYFSNDKPSIIKDEGKAIQVTEKEVTAADTAAPVAKTNAPVPSEEVSQQKVEAGKAKPTETVEPVVSKSSPNIVYSRPLVDAPPRNASIFISRIERAPDGLIVYFIHSGQKGNGTFSVYGPEDPTRCFFVSAEGITYNLKSIYPKGENLTYPSSGKTSIRAVFEKVPDGISKIHIVEGTNRDADNQDYWTFRGVHLSN